MVDLVLAYFGTGILAHFVAWAYYAYHVKGTSYLEVYKTFHGTLFTFLKSVILWPLIIRIVFHPQFLQALEKMAEDLNQTATFSPLEGVQDNRIWISIPSPTGTVWIRLIPYKGTLFATHIILSQYDQPFAVGRIGLTYVQLTSLSNWYPFSFVSEETLDGKEALDLAEKDKEWLNLCVDGKEKERAEYVTQKSSEWIK